MVNTRMENRVEVMEKGNKELSKRMVAIKGRMIGVEIASRS